MARRRSWLSSPALRVVLLAVALAAATCVAYGRLPTCGFVSYDDPDYVIQNPMVAGGVTWEGVRHAFTEAHAANYHPLTWISHMVDVELYGLHPAGHHLTNLLLHLANTLLLFALLLAMTGAATRSTIVAALFALHPVHVESVAWIAERKDVLSVCLALLTVAAYLAYVRRPNLRRYLAVAALFALALLAKPMVVTLPLLLLLLDCWPVARDETATRLVLEKLPLLALSAASTCVTLLAQRGGGAVVSHLSIPLVPRLSNAVVSCLRYLGKLLWPSRLSVFYPHPYLQGAAGWSTWLVVGAGATVVTLSLLALQLRRRAPYLLVGWLWFLIALLPVIGIVQVGSQSMADRYTYLPSIGLFIAAVWGGAALVHRYALPRRTTVAAAVVLLATCAGLTWQQTGYWRDSVALYRHAVAVTDSNWEMRTNLANALLRRDQAEAAIHEYQRVLSEGRWALGRQPSAAAEIHYNLGVAEQQLGNFSRAIDHDRIALELTPDHVDARNNLGVAYLAAGKPAKAIATLQDLLRLTPDYPAAWYNLGEAQRQHGEIRQAVVSYQRFLAQRPGYAEAHLHLGECLERLHEPDLAAEAYRRALRLTPEMTAARTALRRLTRPGEAAR